MYDCYKVIVGMVDMFFVLIDKVVIVYLYLLLLLFLIGERFLFIG